MDTSDPELRLVLVLALKGSSGGDVGVFLSEGAGRIVSLPFTVSNERASPVLGSTVQCARPEAL